MAYVSDRINRLIVKFELRNYLEIGLGTGSTFNNIKAAHKSGVDPYLHIGRVTNCEQGIYLFEMPSDDYFYRMDEHTRNIYKKDIKFDIILIDGLHTFSQALRDFTNSLKYSHEKTIWIFDDTIPSDPYSALPDLAHTKAYRSAAGLDSLAWHGDVFKTVFALHGFYPEFSYATVIDAGNPQTVVWRTREPASRKKLRDNFYELEYLNYFDMLDNRQLFNLIYEKDLEGWIGKPFGDMEIAAARVFPVEALIPRSQLTDPAAQTMANRQTGSIGAGLEAKKEDSPSEDIDKKIAHIPLADYQRFRIYDLLKRIDIKGKTIIEVGSDSALNVAKALAALGASKVIAVNLEIDPSLQSDEQILIHRQNLEDIKGLAGSADLVFGIALLEHVEELDEFATKCEELLKPAGTFYLAGSPLWTSSCGHHVWIQAWGEVGDYMFNRSGKNPWRPWQHLTVFTRDDAIKALHDNGIKDPDAGYIAHQLIEGRHISRRSRSEIAAAFTNRFGNNITIEHTHDPSQKNIYYEIASRRYPTQDLDVYGITITGMR